MSWLTGLAKIADLADKGIGVIGKQLIKPSIGIPLAAEGLNLGVKHGMSDSSYKDALQGLLNTAAVAAGSRGLVNSLVKQKGIGTTLALAEALGGTVYNGWNIANNNNVYSASRNIKNDDIISMGNDLAADESKRDNMLGKENNPILNALFPSTNPKDQHGKRVKNTQRTPIENIALQIHNYNKTGKFSDKYGAFEIDKLTSNEKDMLSTYFSSFLPKDIEPLLNASLDENGDYKYIPKETADMLSKKYNLKEVKK